MNFRYYHRMLLLGSVMLMTAMPVTAQTSSYGELQAAYLYNFAKYISWPGESQQFVIGVFQEADIMDDLETTLKGKKVKGKVIVLKKITTTEELQGCNIIYVSESNSKSLSLLTESVPGKGKGILIVTEEDMIRKGAIISFVIEDDKLRFKLKKRALDEAGLVASDGLLKLAILL